MKKIMILLFLPFPCAGQALLTLTGTIRSLKTGEGLPFSVVAVKYSGQGAVADDHGRFTISFHAKEDDSLSFTIMGYTEKIIPVHALSPEDSLNIMLEEKIFDIPPVVITGISAKEAVRRGIKNVKFIFPDSLMLTDGFYRQYHKENNKYVRLLEAVVVTREEPWSFYGHSAGNEKVLVKALRRSDVYEENREQHGDHLMDVLNENPFKFPVGSVLNEKGIDFFEFHFLEEEQEGTLVIGFASDQAGIPKIEKGKIYIDKDSFVITRIVSETYANPGAANKEIVPAGAPYSWQFSNGVYDIRLKKVNGHYLTDQIKKSYIHYLYDTRVHSLAFIVEEVFEWNAVKIYSGRDGLLNLTFNSGLYSKKYSYHASDWKDFPPLPAIIKHDLETKRSLERQFSDNGR